MVGHEEINTMLAPSEVARLLNVILTQLGVGVTSFQKCPRIS